MTLPDERTRAVLRARDFLLRVMLPASQGGLAKIPLAVRKEARSVLKHYPREFDMANPDKAFKALALPSPLPEEIENPLDSLRDDGEDVEAPHSSSS
jgi:hypothetical protein